MALTRAEQMGRIHGSDTEPEMLLRRALWHRGLRYRVGGKTPAGRPDLVFARRKIAVFIDGCFWHGCPDHYVRPRSRTEFWATKLDENTARDARQVAVLEADGWLVFRVWEHEIFEGLEEVADRIAMGVEAGTAEVTTRWFVWKVEPLDEAGSLERRHLRELRVRLPDHSVDQARHTRKWNRPKAV